MSVVCTITRTMKLRLNWRLVFLLALLAGLAIREVASNCALHSCDPTCIFSPTSATPPTAPSPSSILSASRLCKHHLRGREPTGIREHPRARKFGDSAPPAATCGCSTRAIKSWRTFPWGLSRTRWNSRRTARAPTSPHPARTAVVEIDCASPPSSAAPAPDAARGLRAFRPTAKFSSSRITTTPPFRCSTPLSRLSAQFTSPHPEHIAVLPDSSKAFVSSGSPNDISAVDLTTEERCSRISPLAASPSDLILKPDGGELYITASDTNGLLVLNTQTNEVGDFLMLGSSPSSGTLKADTEILYVSDSTAGHVVPVAMATRQVLRPITVGSAPRTSRLTPGGDILLVVDTASADLAVIRPKTANLITLIPVGPKPRDLAIKVF